MKVLIFGATGSIGRQLVQQALEQGHLVTAFVRNPAKLNLQHANLKIVQGDVLDSVAVEQAVQGQDAVLCSLGSGQQRTGTIRSEGTRQIVRAMEKTRVRRLICQTTLGVGESQGNLNFFWKYIMFGFLLRQVFLDHVRQEEFVKQSHLDWTIVRPSTFVDGDSSATQGHARTGIYRHGFAGTDKIPNLTISRADVADFMLKQLTDDSYLHQTPGVSH
ncbi:NAD(P)-dependent oxidoreductase [Myxacorys almedinensis]|uniref:NAD(P)H-binding protein n=1 Tax=Myxacorys almedinensis A TaxID=2690445 RepID=A0A8J7Z483_9CYAN|nr:SDR family oxidoreductase [Myxacorys almedinensis]NDJ19449.1 NAD(P)H-binding protein [Myxacorys almedinensis A]